MGHSAVLLILLVGFSIQAKEIALKDNDTVHFGLNWTISPDPHIHPHKDSVVSVVLWGHTEEQNACTGSSYRIDRQSYRICNGNRNAVKTYEVKIEAYPTENVEVDRIEDIDSRLKLHAMTYQGFVSGKKVKEAIPKFKAICPKCQGPYLSAEISSDSTGGWGSFVSLPLKRYGWHHTLKGVSRSAFRYYNPKSQWFDMYSAFILIQAGETQKIFHE